MFSMTLAEAEAAYDQGKLSLKEWCNVRDAIREQERQQAQLYQREQTALKVEQTLERLGGRKTPRGYGELPSVFGPGGNLTNQMALSAAAKRGDREAIELTKYLAQQAGQTIPSTLLKDLDRAIEREAQHARLREATTAMAQVNDQRLKLDRNRAEAFPEASASLRARSSGTTPIIPPRGA